jgi:hypothetical protein
LATDRIFKRATINLELFPAISGLFTLNFPESFARNLGLVADEPRRTWRDTANTLRSFFAGRTIATAPIDEFPLHDIVAQQIGRPVFEINRKIIFGRTAYGLILSAKLNDDNNEPMVPIALNRTSVVFPGQSASCLTVRLDLFPRPYSTNARVCGVDGATFAMNATALYKDLIRANMGAR